MGCVYYAFRPQSQAFIFAFSAWLGDVVVVVPGQWWRIIGTSHEVTSLNFKKSAVRFIFQQI
ncbi:hypothetical protein EDWATA_03615 [Edwardsiella tarda ATCC 23685]|uniref:Uncharacterized protein n=1 Tax=Edwardsiella tarda ATCC 23685 TaxID=500638 RepID=D4FA00_EDWTA|nr:hypothetical protein EDWATA_03615 [Edwardsiella tarda ATCC 23685]